MARRRKSSSGTRKKSGGVRPELLAPRLIALGELIPDPRNARRHTAKNVGVLAKALKAHGQHRPLVVQTKGSTFIVRAGNGILAAAKSLKWESLACVVIDEDDAAATARAISDNRASELSEWDDDVLASLFLELPADAETGFTSEEIELLVEEPDPPEAAPAAPATPKAKYTRVIHLHLPDEAHVVEFKSLLGQLQAETEDEMAGVAVLALMRSHVAQRANG